ncbi:hypothetical protein DRW03_21160 [Corallococcus sp. H22C18031201]|nr:hypothetical protein DRW03_21160 [Corallococcus sp. H22C18031201]
MRNAENIWMGRSSDEEREPERAQRVTTRRRTWWRRATTLVVHRYRGLHTGRMRQTVDSASGAAALEMEINGRLPRFHPTHDCDVRLSLRQATATEPPRARLSISGVPSWVDAVAVRNNLEMGLTVAKLMIAGSMTAPRLRHTMAHLRARQRPRIPSVRARLVRRRVREFVRRAKGPIANGSAVMAAVAAMMLGVLLLPQGDIFAALPMPVETVNFALTAAPAGVLGRPIPPEPLQGQKTGKCNEDAAEESINGGCWTAAAKKKPPCGTLWEHGDACYIPIGAEQVAPKKPKKDD